MSANANFVISCEPRRDFVSRLEPPIGPTDRDVLAALIALPSVTPVRARSVVRRPPRRVSWGAANVLAALGSLSTVAIGYLVYALLAPVY